MFHGLSLVVASRGYSPVVVHGLFIALASFIFLEHGLWGAGGRGSTGSVVVVHRLNHPGACGFFPDQGLNLCLLHWKATS